MSHDPVSASATGPPTVEVKGHRPQTVGIVILAVAAVCFALYFGRGFFIPIFFGALFSAILRPLVRGLTKLGLPTTLAAAIVVLGVIGVLAFAGFMFAGPVSSGLNRLPYQFAKARSKFDGLRRPFLRMSAELQGVAQGQAAAATRPADGAMAQPSLLSQAMGGTMQAAAGTLEILFLLFLLLASGDLFIRKLIKMIPLWRDKELAIRIIDEAQGIVIRYILLNAIVMACQGVVVALVMWAWGMPSPWLWGGLSFLLELIPYLGAAMMIGILTVVSVTTFENTGHALLIPASYFVITVIQSSAISPFVYGKQLALNPVAVFVGVMFWWLLWGIPGIYLAVPIIAMIKIISDRTETTKAVGEFLGE